METINVISSARSQMIDITDQVRGTVPTNFNGICHLFVTHTTAGITINENADPDVKSDMIKFFDQLVPWDSDSFNHYEGNSAAHIKSSMMGFSQTIPVDNGKLVLGTWQGIYFCEFDGPRSRKVTINFMGESL